MIASTRMRLGPHGNVMKIGTFACLDHSKNDRWANAFPETHATKMTMVKMNASMYAYNKASNTYIDRNYDDN